MQSYKRKITYFYQFHNGNVGSTAGFLKLEIRGEKVKIIINIQEPPGLPYKSATLYFYHEAGDHLAAIKVDEIESVGGMLTYQTRTEWQQLFDTGRDLYTFDGVAVVYNDSHYYIGDFQDKNRKDYELVRKENRKPAVKEKVSLFENPAIKNIDNTKGRMAGEKVVNRYESDKGEENRSTQRQTGATGKEEKQPEAVEIKENNAAVQMRRNTEREKAGDLSEIVEQAGIIGREQEENTDIFANAVSSEMRNINQQKRQGDVFEKCENCPYHRKRMEQKEESDAFEKMITEYPKLPIYGATELFNCVRIHPKDIGKLDMRNWKLGVNSFLTHGFYTYQYLLLGKMRFDDGSEHAIIGVPGVFSNREKYLANMFGFEQFIPVKKTGIKTGEFGYWIVEISPCL